MNDHQDHRSASGFRSTTGFEIAIVGMAGRFPGADDIEAFERNIRDGVESVTVFSDEQLRERGVSAELLDDPYYVKAGVVFDGADQFDADFFGYTPRDAEHLDPQQRIFLECAWTALEHAGYDPGQQLGTVGVYAGSGANLYLMKHLLPHYDLHHGSNIADLLGLMSGNAADALCTRVAYKLNLRGPAVTVQTACSTSLVAVHLACQSLLGYECDMALAGGVSLNLLQNGGYRYQPGAIFSPDGHCRAFAEDAAGTMLGSGAGIVVLRRLDDALRDGDTIHAVIKGSAVNNDGSDKVGFTAPGIGGQAAVIQAAQVLADVSVESIGYIEAHGTGTTLGDPIEIAALTEAFRKSTHKKSYCAIGSVKTNVGHLDAAAGITGLIKAVLSIKSGTLFPSLNFSEPNAQIDFAQSPFYVNTEARPWPSSQYPHRQYPHPQYPRRAGVSSFGIGGTNAHVVVEEAPAGISTALAPSSDGNWILLPLSARSETELQQTCQRLADHLELHPEQSLIDVASTLLLGRKRFSYRAAALARTREEAIATLRSATDPWFSQGVILSAQSSSGQSAMVGHPGVAFLFPGQGSQYVDMGRALYDTALVFREIVDQCCLQLQPALGVDLRTLIYPDETVQAEAAARLRQTALTQPALFIIEYAMARQWMAWGVQPQAILGHSIGEYVAACLSGVFCLDDALQLVARRAQLMQSTEVGAMLAVHSGEAELSLELGGACDLAAVNAEGLCVLSGTEAAIAQVETALTQRGITTQRLQVSHAFHSSLVEPVLQDFLCALKNMSLSKPQIPFVSNVTGEWISAAQACSPDYWVQHLRQTVRFHEGLGTLLAKTDRIVLEVGPGETLSTLARRHPALGVSRPVLASQCHPNRREYNGDQPALCVAQLWVAGVELDCKTFFNLSQGRRIPLPTYPFARQSYWVQPPESRSPLPIEEPGSDRRDISSWLYSPVWKRANPLTSNPAQALSSSSKQPAKQIVVLGNRDGLSERLYAHLLSTGCSPVWVEFGQGFERLAENRYCMRPSAKEDFEQLLQAIPEGTLSHICHLWSLDSGHDSLLPQEVLNRSFYSLLALIQALDTTGHSSHQQLISLTVITNHLEDVTGSEIICAEKATVYGPCKVASQEYPGLRCRVIDVVNSDTAQQADRLARQLITEMESLSDESLVALRGPHRWVKNFSPLPSHWPLTPCLREQGVYLITGGTGGIGLTLANYLARHWQARLVLVGRTELPPRDSWSDLLNDNNINPSLKTKLTGLLELESTGSELMLVQADVTDPIQVQRLIKQAEQRFGAINGVIHAAGNPGGGVIANKTAELADAVLAPKVRGARNLLDSCADKHLDFLLLCSSLTAMVPTFGQVDYCAANCFLDALALGHKHFRVLSVNWDTWRDTGMAAQQSLPIDMGIPPEQGGQLLERLLAHAGEQQLVVSRIELARQFQQTNALADHLLTDPQVKAARKDRPSKDRPSITTPYVAPESELELLLAELWSDFLGISPIGVMDNLFELGGDSLLAIQLLAKVRSVYGAEVHPATFFKQPTIGVLALLVEERLIEEIENAELITDRTSETS